jgi:acyl-CoA synthetase (AMP-forming)/AMP-acid ligase II
VLGFERRGGEVNFGSSSLGYPAPLLPEIWEIHGRFRAGRRAVVAFDGGLSWLELIDRTNRVANGLLALGLQPGARVGILMSNGVRTLETLIGVLRGGFVATPLNLSISDAAIAGMLTDSGATALFVTADQALRVAGMSGLGIRVIAGGGGDAPPGWLDYDRWVDAQSPKAPDTKILPETIANIIYSSGTTGVPKGIVHSHAGRLAWTNDLALALRYHALSRTLITTGLFSNISWVGMLCTLMMGGTLYIHAGFDPLAVLQTVERERITHVAMVPLQYQRVIEHPQFEQFDRSSMQAMMSAGSKLAPWLKRRLLESFACGIAEDFGMTEGLTTILDPEDAAGRLDSAGLPIVGTEMAVLNDVDSLAAPGEIGEIIGRSRFSMAGYWNRPEATREATWIDDVGRKWLRTGDIGRIDADGYLYVLDRKKDMILSGGQNIYPADIEAVLVTHPGVSECAVIGAPSEAWGETPVAVVVPRHDCPSEAELRGWLNQRLGKQQRVQQIIFREDLPRNPGGKLLKRELRAALQT